jgi:choline dehydrogenase-like flavoprotein
VIADGRRIPDGAALEADVCIAGAGAAGIALARELAGTSLRVVVLEGGGLHPDEKSQALYDGQNTGLPYFPLASARLRYFGGTTNHWDGLARPLEEIDFEPREGVPFSGWPIRRAALDPYYRRASAVCGLPTNRWDAQFWQRRDPSAPQVADGRRIVTRFAQEVRDSRLRFGEIYGDDLRRAPNVTTYLHSNVTEIEVDEAVTRVERLRVVSLPGVRFSVAAKYFVLALGGIENPRLLLASNARRPRGLGNDHDLVGRFFLEHPRYVGGTLLPADQQYPTRFYEAHDVGMTTLRGYIALSAQTRRAEELVDVQMRMRPVYERAYAAALQSEDWESAKALADAPSNPGDFGRHLANVVGDVMSWHTLTVPGAPLPVPDPEVAVKLASSTSGELRSLLPELLGDIAGAIVERADRAPVKLLEVTTRIEPVPNPDSRVTLAPERDELGMPRVRLDWRLSELDRRSARRALEILGEELGEAGQGRVRLLPDRVDGSWPEDLEGGWHHMGTTRMDDDPKRGVVDRDCRVHGLANLFIAGSSVFATAGSGTPTLTIVALTLRLADHLRGLAR